MDAKLTRKQQVFIDEYLISLNASDAARKAGYSLKTAFRTGQENLQKPAIQEAIQARLKEKQSERIAKQDEVLETLTQGLRGELIGSTAKEQIKSAELLGKYYKFFTDKIEHFGSVEHSGEIKNTISLSREDLKSLSTAELKQLGEIIGKLKSK